TSKSVTINVGKATPIITWNNPTDITYRTTLSGTQLNATAAAAGIFAYTPAAGALLNAGNGQTLSVTFTPTDSANYTTATKTATINVLKATPTIAWSNPADITYGTTLSGTQLNATAGAGTLVYTPAAGALLNAGSGQTLSVTFTPTDSANYTPATKTVTINVLKATPTIAWSNPADITYGTTLSGTQLNATAGAGTLVYTPAAGALLNAGSGQTLSVTFTPTDSANYTPATKTVTINVLKATPTIAWSNPADITYGTTLSGTQLNATAGAGTLVYTPAAGALLNAGSGQTLSVTFTPTDSANYTPATKTVTINVLKATPTIAWSNPADITYGTTLSGTQLNATAGAGTLVYTPAAGALLNAGSGQTLSVTFTPTDSANYTPATKTVTINVLKATPTIAWSNPADITYGTTLSGTQLNATAGAGTLVYTPAAGALLNAGSGQTLSVTFTPTDSANYTPATKTVTINVLKATPTIAWSNPANITYGTTLSATQLNATAGAGTLVYTPAAGALLNAGSGQPLSVTFTPTDSANYTPATKTVTINVLKATPTIAWSNPADITYGT